MDASRFVAFNNFNIFNKIKLLIFTYYLTYSGIPSYYVRLIQVYFFENFRFLNGDWKIFENQTVKLDFYYILHSILQRYIKDFTCGTYCLSYIVWYIASFR